MYNCTNRDDVIYKGAIPNVTEIGPFVYQESNSWSEPKQWDVQTTVPGTNGTVKKNAIEMVFNTKTDINWVLTKDPDFETPIWQINQAASGKWYGTLNPPEWRLMLNVSILPSDRYW